MIQHIRVGIPIVGTKEWAGGISYIELLTKAVASLAKNERPRMFFIIPESGLGAYGSHRHILHLFDGLIFLGRNPQQAASVIDQPFDHAASWKSLFTKIDFYFPEVVDVLPNVCAASWIPDFQYAHLKQFFSKQEVAMRAAMAKKIADKARLVVLSSQDVKKDFENEFPDSKAVVRILSFYSLPLEEWYRPNPIQIQKKYGLPDLFIICCNQFWMHKNHIRIFESIAQLRKQGKDIHLVCTGNTKDHRAEGYFERLSKRIKELAINDLVHILGYIPRQDQIQLLRRSAAVIQPSLFEGWGTVVEDARALGKTIVLSKIPIHFEQAPNHSIFFDPHDSEELAGAIRKSLPGLKPGPDLRREHNARKDSESLIEGFARKFCSIAVESQFLFGRRIPTVRDPLWNLLTEPLTMSTICAIPDGCGSPTMNNSIKQTKNIKQDSTMPGLPAPHNQKWPTISIVTPSFNQSAYLEDCIRSVVNQSYPFVEYIIMDGGSTDGSVNIIKKYAQHLSYWQSRPDGGQYAAIQDGMSRCTGEIMTWINSDDVLRPDCLQTVAGIFMARKDVDWITGRTNIIKTGHNELHVIPMLPLWSREKYLGKRFFSPFIQQEGTFWRRSLWEKAGARMETELMCAADLELWTRFFRYAMLHSADCLLATFRQHPAQKTAHMLKRYFSEAEQVLNAEIERYRKERPQVLLPAPLPITKQEIDRYLDMLNPTNPR